MNPVKKKLEKMFKAYKFINPQYENLNKHIFQTKEVNRDIIRFCWYIERAALCNILIIKRKVR